LVPRNPIVKLLQPAQARNTDGGARAIAAPPRVKTPFPFLNSISPSTSHTPLEPLFGFDNSVDARSINDEAKAHAGGHYFHSVSVRRTVSERKKIVEATQVEILNLWQPTPAPATLHRLTPMCAYDINTKLPFRILEMDQVRLEPLVVSIIHALRGGSR
jgi:hypothetical protein